MNLFDRDYYEDGIRKHISGYEDYKWMPTRSIPEALDIKNKFDFNNCVDYGCDKGLLEVAKFSSQTYAADGLQLVPSNTRKS